MSSSVKIRGSKYGISVKLDSDASYEKIKQDVAVSFHDAEKFLGEEKLAISFEGRSLTEGQQEELVTVIHQNCKVRIVCVIDNSPEQEKKFQRPARDNQVSPEASGCQFYKGHLRSGQVLEFENSVIILGDVNPGASVISKGNIIILGSLRGTVFAGAAGMKNSFIVAMDMQPMQLRIADVFAETLERGKGSTEPRIAFVNNKNIAIEPLTKSVLNGIIL